MTMRVKDVYVGKKVYHDKYPHWGYGYVIETRLRDHTGGYTKHRFLVRWIPGDWVAGNPCWMHARELTVNPRRLKAVGHDD